MISTGKQHDLKADQTKKADSTKWFEVVIKHFEDALFLLQKSCSDSPWQLQQREIVALIGCGNFNRDQTRCRQGVYRIGGLTSQLKLFTKE